MCVVSIRAMWDGVVFRSRVHPRNPCESQGVCFMIWVLGIKFPTVRQCPFVSAKLRKDLSSTQESLRLLKFHQVPS